MALWSRMRGVRDAATSTPRWTRRELLVGINLRATLHLVSAREHPAYHAVVEASGVTDWRRTKAPSSDALREALLGVRGDAADGRGDRGVRRRVGRTSTRARSPTRSSSTSARTSWRPLVRWSALTRVPEDGAWTSKTPMALVAAPRRCSAPEDALATVIRRHLRAFGPASAEDVASWIGWRVPPVRAALEGSELDLLALDGGLYDLPDAPRPDAGHARAAAVPGRVRLRPARLPVQAPRRGSSPTSCGTSSTCARTCRSSRRSWSTASSRASGRSRSSGARRR